MVTGGIFASWFAFSPKGPSAFAVGFAETTHRPWSLFYRRMRPTGGRTYLGAVVDEEIAAADNFFEVFFNLMIGLNNYLAVTGGEEPLFSEIPVIVRTNGNPVVDVALSWVIKHGPGLEIDWGREFYLRATYGANGSGEQFGAAYNRHMKQRTPVGRETQFTRWWSLITDRAYVEPSSFQFARRWVEAAHLRRGHHQRGRCAQHDRSMSYSDLACFFDNFHMPLLPPEIDEQTLLETLGSR